MLVVSTGVPDEATITVSLNVPTSSVSRPTSSWLLAFSTLLRCSNVRNPDSSTLMVYDPGVIARNANSPRASLGSVRASSVRSLTSVTVAPGTTWPDESIMVPMTAPVSWAAAGAATSAATMAMMTRAREVGIMTFLLAES